MTVLRRRRSPLLVLAVLALAAAPLPAAAQTSPTPSPSRPACGAPDQHSVGADPTEVPAGATTTVTVLRRLEPCYADESRSHDVTLYARPAGTSDAPTVAATGSTDSSGRVAFVLAPAASTEYSDRADFLRFANGPRVVTVTVGGPRPSPTATPQLDCQAGARVTLDRDTIIATGSAVVTAREVPGTLVDLHGYSRPSTAERVVRSERTDSAGVVRFTVRPGTNTRLRAQQRVEDCTDPVFGTASSVVLNVRTALSLLVERTGVRAYTFRGDSLPARPGGLVVSLYRVTADGRQVLTAQARASSTTGEWSVRRTFTGTGRFGFVVRTGQDLLNAPGTSNVRSLLVF